VAPDLHSAPASANCIGEGPEDLAGVEEDLAGAEEALFTLLPTSSDHVQKREFQTLGLEHFEGRDLSAIEMTKRVPKRPV
jgi:hypothetical protein